MSNRTKYIVSAIASLLICIGCTVKYSFTGASISPDVKTVSIKDFPNMASMPEPSLSYVFTEQLRSKFSQETSLSVVRSKGDIQFEGEITGYNISYESVRSNETAAQSRLTISVHVVFTNTTEPLRSFDKRFSEYETFTSGQSIESVKEGLIKSIVEKLVDDIFMEAVANW